MSSSQPPIKRGYGHVLLRTCDHIVHPMKDGRLVHIERTRSSQGESKYTIWVDRRDAPVIVPYPSSALTFAEAHFLGLDFPSPDWACA
jgi:hypothetical protein